MSTQTFDDRAFVRCPLAPMYTSVIVRRVDAMVMRAVEGHAYDVSESGVRVELDLPLRVDERVSVELLLAGEPAAVFVSGRVVWVNDAADDPGPRRQAIEFTQFQSEADRERLIRSTGLGTSRRCG